MNEATQADHRVDVEQDEQAIESVLDQTLMTEQTVQHIEQHTKSQIEWEQYEQELTYLKKRQQRDAYESKLIEGLAKDPEHVHLLEYLADFYMMDNQHKKALPLYKKLVDKDPNNHLSLWKMAQLYLILKDYQTAEMLLDTALTLHPHTPKYAMSLIELYYTTHRVEQALLLLEDVVKRRPENLSYHNALANLYEELELYDGAVQTYEAMLLIDPTNIGIKRKLLEARTRL